MVNSGTILIIDEDVEVRRLVHRTLERAGYKVKAAEKHDNILQHVFATRCSLVILGMESLQHSDINILKELRASALLPVIILSPPLPDEDALTASVAGATYYVSKPFSEAGLLASVRSVLRSYNTTTQGSTFETESVFINFENHLVSKNGKIINLTPTEFSLLSLFVHNPGKVLTHAYIARQIRGPWFDKRLPYSRVYVGRLRKKLEDDPADPHIFQTESGKGYKLVVKD